MAKSPPDSLELGAQLQRLNNDHARAFERWRAARGAAARRAVEKTMATIEKKRERVRKLLASAGARRAAATRAARAATSSSAPTMDPQRRELAQKNRAAAGMHPTQEKRRRASPKGWRIEDSRALVVPRVGTLTFELRWVLCGKPRCKKWHGPYWYAEQHRGDRVRWVYVGRELDVGKAVERMRAK